MRKSVSFMLALIMIMVLLAGCGSSGNENGNQTNGGQSGTGETLNMRQNDEPAC